VRDFSGCRGDSCRVTESSLHSKQFFHLFLIMPPKKSKKTNKNNQDWAGDDDDSVGESVTFAISHTYVFQTAIVNLPVGKECHIEISDDPRYHVSIVEIVRNYGMTANLLLIV